MYTNNKKRFDAYASERFLIVGTGLEKSNATPRWGVARDGSTERNLNFAKGKMQTSPSAPARKVIVASLFLDLIL